MTSIRTNLKIITAVAAIVSTMGLAQAQSAGGTGAAGSATDTPSGTNMTQPSTSGSMGKGMGNSSGMSKKGSTSAQDCRDHANVATGQKRNDTPQNADTDKTCADMMNKSNMKKSKKSTTGATTGQPAPATSN